MNEILFSVNGWSLVGLASLSVPAAIGGWKLYKHLKEKERTDAEEEFEDMLKAKKDRQVENLSDLEYGIDLMSKEDTQFYTRDKSSVKFYQAIKSGQDKNIYSEANDFNMFFAGMRISQDSIKSFTSAASIKDTLDRFTEYALVSALYFFKDSGYAKSPKGAPEKFDEAKKFVSEDLGFSFENLEDEEFFKVMRIISKTTLEKDKEISEPESKEGLEEESAASQPEDQVGA